MDPLFRKTTHLNKDKYRPQRSTRRQIEDDDSSGFSSSDYGDGPPVVRDVRGSRGTKSLRFSQPSKTQNIDDVQASLSTINSDLARIVSLLQTQALQRPVIPAQPVLRCTRTTCFCTDGETCEQRLCTSCWPCANKVRVEKFSALA